MFWLGATDTGGRMIPSGNFSFAKITLVWMDVWKLNPEEYHFGWRPPWLKGRQAMHLLNYTLESALQLNKSMENLSLGSWTVLENNHCTNLTALAAMTGLLRISSPWLTASEVGVYSQPIEKLTEGKVLWKHKISSLAGLDHSCIWNTQLEMVLHKL
jgi:hypothetical protein